MLSLVTRSKFRYFIIQRKYEVYDQFLPVWASWCWNRHTQHFGMFDPFKYLFTNCNTLNARS